MLKSLPAILLETVAIVAISQTVAMSLTPREISQIANQFVVQVNSNHEQGSGSIIGKEKNSYQVLTNWHVVDQSSSINDYIIQTVDGKTHSVQKIERLKGADLAIITFNSSKNYTVAKLGKSNNLIAGDTIHFAGYPTGIPRIYRFFKDQSITGIVPSTAAQDGYEIIFTGEPLPGVSGGPLLNNEGEIIGIYGVTRHNAVGGKSLYGVRIDTVIKLAQQQNIYLIVLRNLPIPEPSPQPTRNPDQGLTAAQWFERGINLEDTNNYTRAIDAYSQAIELDPNYALAYNNRGIIYFIQRNTNLALADFNNAINLDPNYALAYYNRGVIHSNQGKHELALADFNRVVQLDPDYARAYYNRGRVYFLQRKYDSALTDFTTTINLDPNFAKAYHDRGSIYRIKEKYQLALADYNRAIQLDNNFANAYYNRGLVYQKLGQIDLAKEDFDKARELGL